MRNAVLLLAFALAASACARTPLAAPPAPGGGGGGRATAAATHVTFCPSEGFSVVKIEAEHPGITCAATAPYERMFTNLSAILPRKLPLTTLLLLPKQARFGTYDPRFGKIEIEERAPGESLSPENEAILVHEEGHSLFNAYLAESLPLYGTLFTLNEKNGSALRIMLQTARSFGGVEACQRESSACFKEIARLNAASQVAEAALNAFTAEHRGELDALAKTIAPLHELFADLLTAIYLEDPEAMVARVPLSEACRSFGREYRQVSKGARSPYCELAELRAPLWRRFVKPRLGAKDALLAEVARNLSNEAKTRAAGKLGRGDSLRRLRRAFGL